MFRSSLTSVLQVLLALFISADCNIETCPGSQDILLSNAHVLRSWQPDGDCLRWENRSSELPAAVRSGTRWLVMQLRRPMMLDRVRVLGWDDQWQSAAPFGSTVSARGAASLPLDLQLEDPCQASWEAFGKSKHWSIIGSSRPLVSFLLIESSLHLSWKSLNISGCSPSMKWSAEDSAVRLLTIQEDTDFEVELTSPGSSLIPSCHISNEFSPKLIPDPVPTSSGPSRWKLKLKLRLYAHGSQLICCHQSRDCPIVNTIGVMFVGMSTSLDVRPDKWLVGSNVTGKFTSTDEYPVSNHTCVLKTGSSELPLPLMRRRVIVTKTPHVAYNTVSEFEFVAQLYHRGSSIECRSKLWWSISTLSSHFEVKSIYEPCNATIDLGLKPYWIENNKAHIRLMSTTCIGDQHHCELINGTSGWGTPLVRTAVNGTESTHALLVQRWMSGRQQNWLIRCRANHSNLFSRPVEEKIEVFSKGKLYFTEPAQAVSTDCNCQQWQLKVAEGWPLMSDVSCDLINRTSSMTQKGFEYNFKAEVKIFCSGLQKYKGEVIFNHTVFRSLNSHHPCSQSPSSEDKNIGGKFGDPLDDLLSCEALRTLLFGVVFCALATVASVVACAIIRLRQIRADAMAKRPPRSDMACNQSRCRITRQPAAVPRCLPQLPLDDNAASKPDSFSCSPYDEAEPYSQVDASPALSPYINC